MWRSSGLFDCPNFVHFPRGQYHGALLSDISRCRCCGSALRKSVDLDYADDIVLPFADVATAQSTLDGLSRVVPLFGMRFTPSRCKVLLQDHQPLDNPLTLANEELEVVD
ncbi:unnamed protein product [Dicrocoelium dendriticum]|nr:unnamed protein product [Dicrocoelium dendriticum]